MIEYAEIEKILDVDYTDEELEILKVQVEHFSLDRSRIVETFRGVSEECLKEAIGRGVFVKSDDLP